MSYTIYKLVNKFNKKTYVGCTANLNQRITNHFTALRNKNHISKKMQEDYNKGHEFTFKTVAIITNKKDALDFETKSIKRNSYNEHKLIVAKGYPAGVIQKATLEKIDFNHDLKKKIASYINCSTDTITKWVRTNNDKLTYAGVLVVIREELGLTDSQILEETSKTAA